MADGTTMPAMVTDDYGAPLRLAERPRPEPGSGEVQVRVQAASVNGFDVAVAAGRLRGMMEHTFPAGLGKDFAGTVEAIGEGVSGFAAGDRVFGVVMKPMVRDGSFAQYVTVPEAIGIAHLPDRLDVSVAGALGLAGTAAIQALDALQLRAGELVLVAGATGGVGALAVQLAAASGAVVIATGQPAPDEKFLRELGATHVADYREDPAGAVRALAPKGVDAALHLAGDGGQLAALVRPGGRLVSTLGFSPEQAGERQLSVTAVMANPDAQTLARLAILATSSRLRVPVQATYPLEELPRALADFTGGTRGKLAISVP
jgi:NADPH:quinone reductase-like Zn-dependent oxidoreductase